MHTDNLIVNDGTAGQTVEGIAKLLPHFDREPATALVVKTINPVDPSALMVSTQQEKVLGILDFVGKQQADYFQ